MLARHVYRSAFLATRCAVHPIAIRRHYCRYEGDSEADNDFDEPRRAPKPKPPRAKPNNEGGNNIMLVSSTGEAILKNTTQEEIRSYTRRRNLSAQKVSSGAVTVYKLLDPREPLFKPKEKKTKGSTKKQGGGPPQKEKEIRFSTVISEHDEEFKLDKVIGYLQKGHRVKMMITEKEPWNFNRATCEAKLKEILDKLDPECYSVQQAEVLVPSLAAFGCVIQPKTNYFKKAKADMQKEEEQTQQKE